MKTFYWLTQSWWDSDWLGGLLRSILGSRKTGLPNFGHNQCCQTLYYEKNKKNWLNFLTCMLVDCFNPLLYGSWVIYPAFFQSCPQQKSVLLKI
jgi:hypothetical protein